ncbi:MAG: hypothetical protein KAI24_10530 [Planctomycetes bacterium]|nr:hypothetical protein [Planctomycetota bacterium]
MLPRTLLLAALLLGASCQSAPAPLPEAVVAEVGSTVDALYAVISGPAGQKRDWDRMRALFHRDARLIAMTAVRGGAGAQPMIMTPDDYIERSGPFLEENGFFEQEIRREVQVFGDFAHVWSTYEGRKQLADEVPFLRGINSIELVRVGRTWKVLSILWEQEAQAGAIPERYLPR